MSELSSGYFHNLPGVKLWVTSPSKRVVAGSSPVTPSSLPKRDGSVAQLVEHQRHLQRLVLWQIMEAIGCDDVGYFIRNHPSRIGVTW